MTPVPLSRNRDFLLLQAGQVLSTIGSESTVIAYPLVVLALTHSPAKAGIVGFARIVPWALFGLLAGLAVDRLPRKAMMITSDIVRAFAVGSIAIAAAIGHLTFAHIAAVAFVEGSMYVFFNIAEVGALRSVVSTEQLPTAAAAEQARYSTVTIVAPPLGGSLFGLGRALPFVAGALSPAFSLATLLSIRTPFEEERERDESPLRTQLAEGFRFLWRHPFIRACALFATWTNLVFEGIVLAVIVVARRQGLSSGEIGALIAGLGVFSLLGSAAAPRLHRLMSMRAIVVAGFWAQLTVAAFLAYPSVYVLVGSIAPFAFFVPTLTAVVIGYRVAVTPDRLTGRVNAIARSIALCGAPLGPLAAGLLLGSFSPRTAVAVFTALLVVLAVAGSLSPSIRNAPSLSEIEPAVTERPVAPELAG
ncbi:MAG: MFS transporter [Actinobacteria bacterium]|nr:MAG: MFS transporter [Actinomycetota bacterium]